MKVKFPLRGLLITTIISLVLVAITINSGNERLLWRTSKLSPVLHGGTEEDVQLRFQELANTVNIYFNKFMQEHQGENMEIASSEVQSVLLRHLTSHLNESISSKNIRYVIGIVDHLRKEVEKNNTTRGVNQALAVNQTQVRMNWDVARGRLSEQFKVAKDFV